MENSSSLVCLLPDLTDLVNLIDIKPEIPSTTSRNAQLTALPSEDTRRRRQTGAINPDDVQFFLGVKLDGVESFKLFKRITVYRDPVFHRFKEDKNVRFFKPGDTTIVRIDVSKNGKLFFFCS